MAVSKRLGTYTRELDKICHLLDLYFAHLPYTYLDIFCSKYRLIFLELINGLETIILILIKHKKIPTRQLQQQNSWRGEVYAMSSSHTPSVVGFVPVKGDSAHRTHQLDFQQQLTSGSVEIGFWFFLK